jgi:hypothetical protein
MIITKKITTSVDLLSPDAIFDPNIEKVILELLTKRYVGKCYKSMLIISILKIINRSTIKMASNRLDGGAFVDVTIELEGIVYSKGEILHNCKIIEITDMDITAEHKTAGIKIQKDATSSLFKLLTVGQVIPIIVGMSRYIIDQNSISIIGVPYSPIPVPYRYYNITSEISLEETELIGKIFEMIHEEEKLHDKFKKDKTYEFFRDLTYPYKTNQKFDSSEKASKYALHTLSLDLKNLLQLKDKVLVYPSEDNKILKRIFTTEKKSLDKISDEETIIDSSLYIALADIATKYLQYLIMLRGFVETYPTVESNQKMILYWKTCKMLKS